MSLYIQIIIKWIYRNKIFLSLIGILSLVFFGILFPKQELGSWVAGEINTRAQGAYYISMSELTPNLIPPPGGTLKDVLFIPKSGPVLKADAVHISLDPFTLTGGGWPHGKIKIQGFNNGQAQFKVESSKPSESGLKRKSISWSVEQVDIKSLTEGLGISLLGAASSEGQLALDEAMSESPEGEFSVDITPFGVQGGLIRLESVGPTNIPGLKVSSIKAKGRWTDGKIYIDEGTIGSGKDELYGTFKADFSYSLQNGLSAYRTDLDLVIKGPLKTRAGYFLVLLDSYLTPLADGSRLNISLTGNLAVGGIPYIQKR